MSMDTRTRSTPRSVFDGEPLLRTVATALVALSRRAHPDDPVYETVVQRAFDQLVLLCLRRGATPPGSVPEMVRWARTKPVTAWPLDLFDAEVDDHQLLVDPETVSPTQFCLEWAISSADPTAEQFENLLMNDAITTCRAAQAPDSYTALRRLMIERPALTSAELAELSGDIDLHPVLNVIRDSYEPAPAAYLRNGHYSVCKGCRCLMVPTNRGVLRCELDRCKREGNDEIGREIPVHAGGGVQQLRRPLRMFITGPGRAEIDLEISMVKLRLRPEMWPNFDAYDLRITLPDGQVWAIDVKDRANPALLGRSTVPFRTVPPFTHAFLVVPAYRLVDREDYQRVFHRNLPTELRGKVKLHTDKALLTKLRTALRRARASRAAGPEQGGTGA